MEETVSEQRQVLVPNASKLEEAWRQKDLDKRPVAAQSEWSPSQLPYKTYEKDQEPDSDEELEVEDGLEVGVEEVGFKYKGPEPTSFGDWAHKGRVTDF